MLDEDDDAKKSQRSSSDNKTCTDSELVQATSSSAQATIQDCNEAIDEGMTLTAASASPQQVRNGEAVD